MKHPLFTTLSANFTAVIQSRGADYFARGAVRLAESGPERVLAFVQGSRRYTVDLRFGGPTPELSCTCPYFMDREEPCKHLWAVLLQLERSDYFRKRDRGLEEPQVTPPAVPRRVTRPAGAFPPPAHPQLPPIPAWARTLHDLQECLDRPTPRRAEAWPPDRQVFYVLDVPRTAFGGQAVVQLYFRDRDKMGNRGRRQSREVALEDLRSVPNRRDRGILAVLRGTGYGQEYTESVRSYLRVGLAHGMLFSSYRLNTDLARLLLPRMCATGRLYLRIGAEDPFSRLPVERDEGEPWELHLELGQDEKGGGYRLRGLLRRGEQSMSLSKPELLVKGGLMFAEGALCRYRDFDSFPWVATLREQRRLRIGPAELPALLKRVLSLPWLPPLEIAEAVGIRTLEAPPLPRLRIAKAESLGYSRSGGALAGELSFGYDERIVPAQQEGCGEYLEQEQAVLLRRPEDERKAAERLAELGLRRTRDYVTGSVIFRLGVRRLAAAVQSLLAEGWYVEAEGKIFRPARGFNVWVTSGVDWFEVRGAMRFGETEAPLPELLKALKKHENTVRLGDGSYGILPEEWLRGQGLALKLGQAEGDHLRFVGSQALVVDQLLRAQPEADVDEGFRKLREQLGRVGELESAEAPPGFVGELRGYQKHGLGWFAFLDELGFGGCLADDMGLGKTVQVLALLEARRSNRAAETNGRAPSLVVVPRSLMFNWKQEARRFTPSLKVLEHGGPGRAAQPAALAGCDVVLTTYGTMRNDIAWLKDLRFDYLVLDEAQVIKNPVSITARAARLLQGRRKLALSGTPIENHLGELWSLFEFLNPGLLGGVSVFRRTIKTPESLEEEARKILGRFLRPFILRRTKEQVAPELPAKVEQTLFCELLPAERRRYVELQEYYRRRLLEPLDSAGLDKAKIMILEALLRLRQAACHPGLLDPAAVSRPGAKLDLLLEQLEDVVTEERKALVFSQFTSLLAILRKRLEERGIPYEYLDGRTRDRAGRVEHFQNDPACPLFLISLKAGGLGLNLTAAEYVFLLDPWWNPATELQAIDRTHRIGQDKKVFAYRLIAKDTVEEKVLELQKAKRALADSIITADGSLLGELTHEDLDFLLS